MAITHQNTAPRQSRPFALVPAVEQERPKAQLWLNVGYERNGKFINLPFGLPIDTMNPAAVRGQNPDWLKQVTAQNALLDMLKKAGMQLEPGQAVTLNLEIQLRRVNETPVVEEDTNEFSIDFSSLIAAPVAQSTETLVAAE